MIVSQRFLVIAALFITCLITANIIAVKLITLGVEPIRHGGFQFPGPLPAAIVIFPLSYIFGDILTEVYGYRQARKIIWLGFFCNLIAVLAFWVAGQIPALDSDVQNAYERILGYTPRILAASFSAYLVGEFANSFVLAKMKIKTKGRFLWTRTIGSTLVGEGLDALVFIAIAFGGTMPWALIGGIILTHWLVKTGYEVVATPFTYMVVNFLKKKEGIDTYDHDTDFNPFLVTR
ncbi:MAG: queuosine precursor transporter [Chloroflexi bacterium]|nr:queuosine precursor transporter [Chloroflexota bacterium]